VGCSPGPPPPNLGNQRDWHLTVSPPPKIPHPQAAFPSFTRKCLGPACLHGGGPNPPPLFPLGFFLPFSFFLLFVAGHFLTLFYERLPCRTRLGTSGFPTGRYSCLVFLSFTKNHHIPPGERLVLILGGPPLAICFSFCWVGWVGNHWIKSLSHLLFLGLPFFF